MTFEKGDRGGPGRPRNARNRLSKAFLDDLLREWEAHGASALKLMRLERPGEFVKVVAGLLPKEFLLEASTGPGALSDEDLDALIEQLQRHVLEERQPIKLIESKELTPNGKDRAN